jgi:hypothetical protein
MWNYKQGRYLSDYRLVQEKFISRYHLLYYVQAISVTVILHNGPCMYIPDTSKNPEKNSVLSGLLLYAVPQNNLFNHFKLLTDMVS